MVSLEKAQVVRNGVVGSVYVRNVAPEKNVVVRFTLNNWATFSDLSADWKESIGGTTEHPDDDRFSFVIPIPSANWSGTIEFAVRCCVAGQTSWDNNNERNYTIFVGGNNG